MTDHHNNGQLYLSWSAQTLSMRHLLSLSILLFSVICSAWGQNAHSSTVNTQATPTPLFSFGVFSDCQYCECPTSGSRYYALSKNKLREAIQTFNAQPLSFVVSLGDFINSGKASYDTLTPIIRALIHPFYFVYGNHDFIADKKTDRAILRQWEQRKRYYSFQRPGWRFIVLDSNDISLSTSSRGSKEWEKTNAYVKQLKANFSGNANDYNGALSPAQMKWLQRELKQAERRNEKVIVMNHMPIVPIGTSDNLWNDRELEVLLKGSPQVVAYFCGHHHKGNYFLEDNIHFVNFQGMVEAEGNTYSLVHVFEDRLEVEGYGLEASRTLSIMPGDTD